MILAFNIVKNYLSEAGFTGEALDWALQIAKCESGFNTEARLLSPKEDSRGLMQINVRAHPEFLYYDLYDPLDNCVAAYQLFKRRGENFLDWTCAQKLGLVYPKKKNDSETGLYAGLALAFLLGISLYLLSNKT
jgi:hypothetical protein